MRLWESLFSLCALASCAQGTDLLIRNVTIVDVVTGAEQPKHSILIRGDRIAAIAPHLSDPKAHVVDGTGKYLIPGLWDMHVHLWYHDNQFPLFLANGVTGVRDMGSDLNWVNRWRDEIRSGKLAGPHIETCGPAVDGNPSGDEKLPVFVVRNPAEARSTFDRLDDMNVDFVKVLSSVPRDAYFALIERARKYYIPVAGHVPDTVSVFEAVDARQKSLEHMTGILLACSSREAKLRNRRMLALEKRDYTQYREINAEIMATYDAGRAAELFERMARFETREVPTLVMLRRSSFADADQLAVSPHLRYISPEIRRDWEDPREARKRMTPETLELANLQYEKLCQLITQMHRARVMLLAGTDTGDPYSFPGFDLHRELELLVQAGLSPLDALRTATLEPAKYLDATDSLGSIAKGKLADLVLLDADPLTDIRNTQKIDGLVLGGRYLSKAQLHALLVVHRH